MTNRKEKAHSRDALFSRPDLLSRGWTDAAIRKFLPSEPDDTRPNPRYSTVGSPMKFWLRTRVLRVEATATFVVWRDGLEFRAGRARRGVETRVSNMIARTEEAEITIQRGWSFQAIHDLAERTHSGRYQGDPGPFRWSMEAGRNCIRHRLTNYERLWSLFNRGETGRAAYETLRERVEALVSEAYPEFADESLWTAAEGRRLGWRPSPEGGSSGPV